MSTSLENILEQEQLLGIAKELSLTKALQSNDVQEIWKAQKYLQEQQRQEIEKKSYFVDPLDLSTSLGYKDKRQSVSYTMLRGMAKTHIIKSIIETRKEQVMSFCSPQETKYTTGFVIQKKKRYSLSDKETKKLTKAEEQKVEDITNFILDCGNTSEIWDVDTFETFCSKIVGDALTLDQATFECTENVRKDLIGFFATDGATYRIADTYDNDSYDRKDKEVKGYLPSYVQIYQNNITAEFYPWELCFGVRNPSTDILKNGYGTSELEDMIQIVTAILNADLYNSNFFKVGSSPKGILRYSGNINTNSVDDFRKQWQSQVAGVANAHKIPIINADKMDFISTQVNNRDMEWSNYQEFLIKISCAMYKIDPSEIGFPMSGSAEAKPMFEGNNEARLKYSKDKGLKPLLKRIEFWINKYIIRRLDPEFEFKFVGIDENDIDTELDQDIKELSNFATIDEIRGKRNKELLGEEKGGSLILNPIYSSFLQQKQMSGMMQDQQNNNGGGFYNDTADTQSASPFNEDDSDTNPFTKALQNELPKLLQ